MTTRDPDPAVRSFDPAVAHPARVYNVWLGGKDHYAPDRAAAQRVVECRPQVVAGARANRQFLGRVVRYLAGTRGVSQFLDIGTGLPAPDNTHEVAQSLSPAARIVYADNDPLVLAHARDLLTSTAEGACAYVHADMREPRTILTASAGTLDLDQPTAVLLIGVLGHVSDYAEARSIVSGLLEGLPPGSYLALADSISSGPAHREAGQQYAQTGAVPYQLRTPAEIHGFFADLELVAPGVVPIPRWRPDPGPVPPAQVGTLGGVARKTA